MPNRLLKYPDKCRSSPFARTSSSIYWSVFDQFSPVPARFGPEPGVLGGFFRSSVAPLLQIAHSDQVPAGEGQQEHVVDPLLASDFDLAHLANGLGPA